VKGTGTPVRSAEPFTDRQGRTIDYLRVSVTDRCNYRCTYCMPEDGLEHLERADILSFEEVVRIVRCFTELGVRRIRLTGGEPTVRRDLVDLVRMLRSIPAIEDIALSTNGHLLEAMAVPLRVAGVDRLNVSLDTLDPVKFVRITGRGELGRVLAGIEAAGAAGFSSIKTNAVAVKGFNDGEVGSLCDYAWSRGAVPRFIEQMPMAGGTLFVPGQQLSAEEIRDLVLASHPGCRLVPEAHGAVAGAGPARYWRLEEETGSRRQGQRQARTQTDQGHRRFGIISPITEHFCATCNRLRLSASGALHTCLGYDDATDLRAALQGAGEAAVLAAIRAAVAAKRDGHSFGLLGIGGPRKAMIQIGG
jgi:cyclic pyranopterin phosphate synthase